MKVRHPYVAETVGSTNSGLNHGQSSPMPFFGKDKVPQSKVLFFFSRGNDLKSSCSLASGYLTRVRILRSVQPSLNSMRNCLTQRKIRQAPSANKSWFSGMCREQRCLLPCVEFKQSCSHCLNPWENKQPGKLARSVPPSTSADRGAVWGPQRLGEDQI